MKKNFFLIINFPTRDLEFKLDITDKEVSELYENMVLHQKSRFPYQNGYVNIPKIVLENNIFQFIKK